MFYIPIKASVEAELNSLIEAVTQAKDVFQNALSKTGCEQVSKADKLARKVGNYRSGLRYLKHTGGLSDEAFFETFNSKLYYQIQQDASDCLVYIRGMRIEDAEYKITHIKTKLEDDIEQKYALALIEKMHYHRKQLAVYSDVDSFISAYLEKVNWLSAIYAAESSADTLVSEFFYGKLSASEAAA